MFADETGIQVIGTLAKGMSSMRKDFHPELEVLSLAGSHLSAACQEPDRLPNRRIHLGNIQGVHSLDIAAPDSRSENRS